MKKKERFLVMIICLLAMNFLFISCENEPESGGNVEGIWVADFGNNSQILRNTYIFSNGNCELISDLADGSEQRQKGTYTTSGGKITIITTHILFVGNDEWYQLSEDEKQRDTLKCDYSVNGNKLTLTMGSSSVVLTKK